MPCDKWERVYSITNQITLHEFFNSFVVTFVFDQYSIIRSLVKLHCMDFFFNSFVVILIMID